MAGSPVVEREWILNSEPGIMRIRCRFRRRGKQLLDYTVQLEFRQTDTWQPIVRYDNAHGFRHCDTIHPDGTHDKTPITRGDANANFTWAIKDLRDNWPVHRSRYQAELQP